VGGEPAGREVALHFDSATDIRISIALVPYLSVLGMVLDSVCDRRSGLPPSWRRRVGEAVGGAGRRFIRPLIGEDMTIPDIIVPLVPRFDSDVAASVDAIRGASVDRIELSVHRLFGDRPPTAWQSVLRSPSRWADGFGRSIESAWEVIDPLWKQVTQVVDREVERVGIAAVRGQVPTLLGTLNGRIRLVQDGITYHHPTPGDYHLGNRRVVLVPMVAGDHALISDFDQADLAWLGYPVPGLGNCWQSVSPQPEPDDRLGLLIGPQRADMLRLMDRPITMREIATALRYAPSTITFHCDWLEDAGLIWRRKHGRSVRAGLSPRGERLLAIMR